jgi:hypothetical protein
LVIPAKLVLAKAGSGNPSRRRRDCFRRSNTFKFFTEIFKIQLHFYNNINFEICVAILHAKESVDTDWIAR